ncbi:MAG: sporulation integral membrane protein YtvI [Bacillus sp. (in: firmicutes)]
MNSSHIQSVLRFGMVLIAISLALLLLLGTFKLVYPFWIGFVIAYLINPAVGMIQNVCRLPRALAVCLVLLLIVSLAIGMIALFIAEVASGANHLSQNVPIRLNALVAYGERMAETFILPSYEKVIALFSELDDRQKSAILDNIKNAGQEISSSTGAFIQDLLQNIPVIISWIPNAATALLFSVMATFFISKDWYHLRKHFQRSVPRKIRASSILVIQDLRMALFGFLKAQLILISITTILVLLGLLILRVEYAITIALVTGIVDLLPYLGSGTIFIPWIVYEIIAGDPNMAIGLSVLYFIIIIQRQIMEPKVLSQNIGIDPLATLISLFVCYSLFGLIGLAIGPLMLVLFNAMHRSGVFHDLWNFIKGDKPHAR